MALEPETNSSARPQGGVIHSSAPAPAWAWQMDGPPGAPAVMLLHGWMTTAALNWYSSLSYLGERFRVVAPNLRGHGRQGRVSPPFSLDGCSDDLAALIEALELQGVIVVGYSMGGAVAQVLARRHRLLGGIVLCATAGSFARRLQLRPLVRATGRVLSAAARQWPEAATGFLHWRMAHHDQVAEARQSRAWRRGRERPARSGFSPPLPAAASPVSSAMAPGMKAAAHRVSSGRRPGHGRRHPVCQGELGVEGRELSHLAAFIESGAELNAYDSSSWLPSLHIPTAVLVTARDRIVAPWRQEAMAALVPGAKRYLVDAGHDAVVAKPDIFLPVLAQACADLAR